LAASGSGPLRRDLCGIGGLLLAVGDDLGQLAFETISVMQHRLVEIAGGWLWLDGNP
jgi:hypothetical protein